MFCCGVQQGYIYVLLRRSAELYLCSVAAFSRAIIVFCCGVQQGYICVLLQRSAGQCLGSVAVFSRAVFVFCCGIQQHWCVHKAIYLDRIAVFM